MYDEVGRMRLVEASRIWNTGDHWAKLVRGGTCGKADGDIKTQQYTLAYHSHNILDLNSR